MFDLSAILAVMDLRLGPWVLGSGFEWIEGRHNFWNAKISETKKKVKTVSFENEFRLIFIIKL